MKGSIPFANKVSVMAHLKLDAFGQVKIEMTHGGEVIVALGLVLFPKAFSGYCSIVTGIVFYPTWKKSLGGSQVGEKSDLFIN